MLNKLIILLLTINLYSVDFKVATYNVENLFDMVNNKTEYKEFKPNSKYWNHNAMNSKIKNVLKVINNLDADILALQELENKNVFNILKRKLPQYKYSYFLKKRTSSIGIAIFSKYKIISNKSIDVSKYNPHSRPILKSTILIDGKKLIVYVNHWRSKRAKESKRIPYAKSLLNDIKKLNKEDDYIILGDLNSNYNEYITFKHDNRLNDTYGITAINQILNTTKKHNFISKKDILKNEQLIHYNLWLELSKKDRFSSKYRGNNNTPDNIILPHSMFDNKNISYVNNSFKVFKKEYLYRNNKVLRWNMKKHSGYSDHLPIYAIFSTKNQAYKETKKSFFSFDIFKSTKKEKEYKIDDLYNIQTLNNNIILKNITVIYKASKLAVIKSKNSRAIIVYKTNNDLEEGYNYDLKVQSIIDYKGSKEINKYEIIKKISKNNEYKKMYLKYKNINDISYKNENEIITNINGIYKKNKLIVGKNKIKIYFKKPLQRPKQNSKIYIKRAIISIYNTRVQLTLAKQSDFKANFR